MTPLYRALCETSLSVDGVLEPSVSSTGVFRDENGDLLNAEDGVALILSALAFADAATGATIGREVCQALSKQLGLKNLKARYEVERSSSHLSSDELIDALDDARRALVAQRSIEARHGSE